MGMLSSPTPDATTTTKGKASFSSTNFAVTAGAVTIKAGGVAPGNLATGAAAAFLVTAETTASTSYADLASVTDTVTVTIGANGLALVSIYALIANNTTTTNSFVGITVSGANTVAANDNQALVYLTSVANGNGAFGAPFLYSGLAAGSTTFKMKYRVAAGTGTFTNRRISAIPL